MEFKDVRFAMPFKPSMEPSRVPRTPPFARRAAGPQATSFEGDSADLTDLSGLDRLADLFRLIVGE
jgi:hypothetical protein